MSIVGKRYCTSSRMDDEMAVVLGKFGDDGRRQQQEGESTLLDQYERLSFEVHLKQAMLGRSLSEPSSSSSSSRLARTRAACSCAAFLPAPPPASIFLNHNQEEARSRRKSRFQKVVKMLIKPFILGKTRPVVLSSTDVLVKHNKLWKTFSSRSVRGV